MTNRQSERRARVVGRTLRLLLGLALVWMTYDVMRIEDAAFNLRILATVLGLTAFYAGMHFAINKYVAGLNAWIGAFLAVTPVVLVFVFGGPLGRVAAVAYIGISLVLQAIRNDGGCEVMSIPGILFGRHTHLVCIVFSPIDWVEQRVAGRRETAHE